VSAARQAFLARLSAYRATVRSPLIVDRSPSERKHNAQARLFRNGLSVVGFALLEDFLRSRSSEVLEWLSTQTLTYLGLPSKLQRAATDGSVRALRAQYDNVRRRGTNMPAYLADLGVALASLTGSSMTFSSLALGWRGSNLQTDEVGDMLGAFEVADGWTNIERMASRAGVGSLTVRTSFDNALESRHVAAHQATANVQPTDLQFFARDALGIALGYDAVLSRAARLVASGSSGAAPAGALLQDSIRIRFLEKQSATWREHLEGSPSTIKRERVYARVEASARRHARASFDLIVILDTYSSPYRWITTDVP
jgi:hypothetical protein